MRFARQLISILAAARLFSLSAAIIFKPGKEVKCADFKKTKLPLRYSWLGTNVRFPTDDIRQDQVDNGKFITSNSIQSKFQVSPFGKGKKEIIVAMPRFKKATPVTLARADFSSSPCSPSFHPFPNWEIQEVGKHGAIQSAVDIYIDKKNQLYVLDSGVVSSLSCYNRTAAPQVLIVDMFKSKLLKRIDLSGVAAPNCEVENMAVDVSSIAAPMLYIGDSFNNRIIIWDVKKESGRSIQLPCRTMEGCAGPDTLYLALGTHKDGSTILYFSQFCAKNLYSIDAAYLRHGADITDERLKDEGEKPRGMVFLGTDKMSNLFLRYGLDSSIYRWDVNTPYEQSSLQLVHDGDEYRMSTAVAPGFNSIMFGMDSNFEDFMYDRVGCLGPSVSLFPLVRNCSVDRDCYSCPGL